MVKQISVHEYMNLQGNCPRCGCQLLYDKNHIHIPRDVLRGRAMVGDHYTLHDVICPREGCDFAKSVYGFSLIGWFLLGWIFGSIILYFTVLIAIIGYGIYAERQEYDDVPEERIKSVEKEILLKQEKRREKLLEN